MALTDKNLYAYCDNNPVIRKDTDGNLWQAIVIGAAVNVVTSYFSALATGQEFGLKDLFVTAVSGGFSAISGWGPFVGGFISAGYAYIEARNKNASKIEATWAGATAFVGTALNGGSLAAVLDLDLSISATVTIGTSFGMGGNMISAAVYKGVTDNAEVRSVSSTSNSSRTTRNVVRNNFNPELISKQIIYKGRQRFMKEIYIYRGRRYTKQYRIG